MNYSADFILWDVEELVREKFKNGDRVVDLHEDAKFKEMLEFAQETGQEGKVHEIVSDLFKKYSRVIRNPDKI